MPRPLAAALDRSGVSGVLYEDVNDPRGDRAADVQRGSRRVRRSRAAAAESAAVRRAHAEARVHDARPHLLDRLRAGSEGSRCSIGRDERCSIRTGSGRSGIRCAGAAGLRSCRRRSSGSFSPSTARSGCRSAPATTRTTSASPATGSTRRTTTSSIGLIGKDLFPLSAIVQTMRTTQQTSLYLERLGPFLRRAGGLAERTVGEDGSGIRWTQVRVGDRLGSSTCDLAQRLRRTLDVCRRPRAGRSLDFPSTRENRHRRNRADAEPLAQIGQARRC